MQMNGFPGGTLRIPQRTDFMGTQNLRNTYSGTTLHQQNGAREDTQTSSQRHAGNPQNARSNNMPRTNNAKHHPVNRDTVPQL